MIYYVITIEMKGILQYGFVNPSNSQTKIHQNAMSRLAEHCDKTVQNQKTPVIV